MIDSFDIVLNIFTTVVIAVFFLFSFLFLITLKFSLYSSINYKSYDLQLHGSMGQHTHFKRFAGFCPQQLATFAQVPTLLH